MGKEYKKPPKSWPRKTESVGGKSIDPPVSQWVELAQLKKEGGPGKWVLKNESMSPKAAAYQKKITGLPVSEGYKVTKGNGGNHVWYDGWNGKALLEAKSNHESFCDPETKTFKPWFTGQISILTQLRKQSSLAGTFPVEWHFEKEVFMDTISNELDVPSNIKFIYTP